MEMQARQVPTERPRRSLKVTRIVHSCVLLDYGDVKVLTDPWFSEKPGYYHGEPLGMTVDELPGLAAVLVSHSHYDHYDMGGVLRL